MHRGAEATSSLATQKQCWTIEKHSGSSFGGGETGGAPQKLVGPYVYSGITNDYQSDVATASCSCYPYSFHYGTDIVGRQSDKTSVDTSIYGSGSGTVEDLREEYVVDGVEKPLGKTLLVKYSNVLNKNGVNIGDVYLRYCHLEKIYVKIGAPVTGRTYLAKRGHTGSGCLDSNPHLHLEATTNAKATASNSPSEKGPDNTDSKKFDIRDVLYTKTSTTGIGKRECMVDHDSPFNKNIYCSHGNAWYSLDSFPSYD